MTNQINELEKFQNHFWQLPLKQMLHVQDFQLALLHLQLLGGWLHILILGALQVAYQHWQQGLVRWGFAH